MAPNRRSKAKVVRAARHPRHPPHQRQGARNARIGEEDFVERRVIVHLSQGSYLDTRLVHWQDEVRQPLMLGTPQSVRAINMPKSA